jgi:hypothetical protein
MKCIDSRTRIPLFIAATTSVNEKQPFRRIFVKKLSVRSVSVTYGKTNAATIAAAAGSSSSSAEANQPR